MSNRIFKSASGLFFIALFLFKLHIITGCANIVPPSGGPRDTLPPKLANASPADSTVNFRAKTIVLTFNEFIDLQDVASNLLFTPTFEHNPLISSKLRTLTIRLKDTLQHNTTYTFNFGNAIRDVDEGNVIRNFTYIFSTGPWLDTTEMTGKVILAENAGTDTTLLVVLHKNPDDSAVMKERPEYVARVDRNGNFRFRNLHSLDTFAIYAIGDASFSKKYMQKTQLFAFADRLQVSGKSPPLTLYAYREANKPQPVQPSTSSTGSKGTANEKNRLKFTASLTGTQQELLRDLVLDFPIPLKIIDSNRVHLSIDSSYTPVSFTVVTDSTKKELHINTQWKENTRYHLILDKDFATDTSGRQLLKADTIIFITKRVTDYSKSVRIRIRGLDTSQPAVLQFVQSGQVVYSAPMINGYFNAGMFIPGDYELRILYDRNRNGKWDPGSFFKIKKQPELVVPVEKRVSIKPASDNEFERSL